MYRTVTAAALTLTLGLAGCGVPEENAWEEADRLAATAPTRTPAPLPTPRPPAPRPTHIPPAPSDLVPVVRVIDGDTVHVLIDGERRSYRVVGLNTPETVHPTQPVECYGPEASAEAKRLLSGGSVDIVPDPSQGDEEGKDKYGRWLAYIVLPDGTDYGEHMIRQGFGTEYRYNSDYARMETYRAAEDAAALDERGLWGACL